MWRVRRLAWRLLAPLALLLLHLVISPGDALASGYTVTTLLASLASPHGVAVDSGSNLYIADYGNDDILEASPPVRPVLTPVIFLPLVANAVSGGW